MAENSQPADTKPAAKQQRQAPFAFTLYQFQETIDAIHQIHDEICTHAAELDRQRISPENLSAVKSLDPERREKFKVWLTDNFKAMREDGAPEEPTDDDVRVLNEVFGDNPVAIGQAQALLQRRLLIAPSREMLLRSSLLTMAVSAFEVLLGGLASRHYEMHPGSLGDDKRFSLKQIAAYDSLEDVQDAAIEHRVYHLLQAPLEDWAKWLDQESNLGLKLKNLAVDYDELEEIIQRRHVIVHNGGDVSARYLEKVRPDEDLEIGASLEVSDEYLGSALEQLDSLGNLVGVGVWSKNRPDAEDQAISVLSNRMEQLLFAGRWQSLRQICFYGAKRASLDVHKRIFQVNEWLAIKRLGDLEAITDDIKGWDTSALEPQFQLVQMALLDDADAFFRLVPEIYRKGGIQREPLDSWPVFEELRQDSRFAAMLNGKNDVDPIV